MSAADEQPLAGTVLVRGPAASGKSAWLVNQHVESKCHKSCLIKASTVWGSWEHGEPESELLAAFRAALHSTARRMFIDDIDLICTASSSVSRAQPVSLRLEDLLARILDCCRAMNVHLIATCTSAQRLPARLMTPQRFNRVFDLHALRPAPSSLLLAPSSRAAAGVSTRPPGCMTQPREVALTDLVLDSKLLDEVRVDCILPLLSSKSRGLPRQACPSSAGTAACTPQRPLACNGLLLYGESGNGKTVTAHAIAHAVRSSGCASAWVVDSAALVSKYVGETEGALAAVFAFARENSPSLLVLDGIDMLVPGSARSAAAAHSSRSWDRVLSTLLTELDGIHTKGSAVSLLATATAVGNVDEALRRPGRLGTHLRLGAPDSAMCRQHASQWAAAAGENLSESCLGIFLK